jgi:hypothetical protein
MVSMKKYFSLPAGQKDNKVETIEKKIPVNRE